MEKFPGIKRNSEFDTYYQDENLYNTDLSGYENLNSRRPDAYVGFSNEVFLSPQFLFTNSSDDLEWYDDI